MRPFYICLILGMCVAAGASAQTQDSSAQRTITLSGIVKGRDGNRINGAEIVANFDHAAISDDNGAFSVPKIPGDTINLLVRRIGYLPHATALVARPGVTGITIQVTLAPVAIQLGTIVIEGKSLDRDLWAKGFYKRADLGNGVFFTPEQMAKTQASLGTIMQTVPSMTVARRKGGVTVPMARVGGGISGPSYCAMNVFLDGIYLPWATDVGIDAVVNQRDVKAMEVYNSPSLVPNRISGLAGPQTMATGNFTINDVGSPGGNSGECGAILIWTKSVDVKKSKR